MSSWATFKKAFGFEGPASEWMDADRKAHHEEVFKRNAERMRGDAAFARVAENVERSFKLAAVRSAPSREAFDAWREHPVTLFVFAALRHAADEQQTTWADVSWHGGTADQTLLSELRVRADAYKAIEEGGYEAFCEWAGLEPAE